MTIEPFKLHDTPRRTFMSQLKRHAFSGVPNGLISSILVWLITPITRHYDEQALSLGEIVALGFLATVATSAIIAYSTYRFNGYHVTTAVLLKGVVFFVIVGGTLGFFASVTGNYFMLAVLFYLWPLVLAFINYLIISPLIARRNRG